MLGAEHRLGLSSAWAAKAQSLRFTLGDYCYWQFKFDALTLDPSLSDMLRGSVDPDQPLRGAEPGCDYYVIRSMPIVSAMPLVSQADGFIRYAPAQYDRRYVEFQPTFDAYLQKFSSKSRSTWRRKVRKFGDQSGGLEWRQYRSSDEIAAFYPLAEALSAKTYQEKMFGDGFAAHAGSLDELKSLAACDEVRGFLLFFKGEPAAYVLCPCDAETIFYGSLGYDPKLRTSSPGDVLLFLMIEQLHAERRFRYLDFGEGESWYKDFYSTNSLKCARVYYLRRTLKNRLALAAHQSASAATDALGHILSRLGVRALIRRLLRRRATADEAQEAA